MNKNRQGEVDSNPYGNRGLGLRKTNIWYELLTVIISEFFFMPPIEKQVYCRLFNGGKNKSPT